MKDILGCRFGRLTVVESDPTRQWTRRLRCACDCGGETLTNSTHLKNGNTQSCGCLQQERARASRLRHGEASNKTRTRLYRIWAAMVSRCHNPNMSAFAYYGGRGISVCPEWRNSYIAFRQWAAGNGYNDRLSLDRANNGGNYEPQNCRWATAKEQANNRRPRTRIGD